MEHDGNNLQRIATVAVVVAADAAVAAAAEGNVDEIVLDAVASSLVDVVMVMVLNAEAALLAHLHLEILVPPLSLTPHH